ncbi:MAG: Na/Pi symporter [Verrucomicrobiota bacterium]|jgi:phosphate:Na+ symporter|nr:Na/Pi symporter [Verrucomicrobiota bacterium]
MSAQQIILLLFQVLGGLSLFIYGMHVMTGSLRQAAGNSLRKILARATRSRLHGVVFGIVVGFLAHSGAATTMLAGFINAGVMTLGQSIAPVFGANIGTSLSMQLVSFHIASYCWVAIGIGFLISALVPSDRWSKLGNALIGFGLLFLGMDTISSGIAPHKEALAPLLEYIRGDTWGWRLVGVGISAMLTALITSSGAMIGLCFALVHAGVFTEFNQAGVIVIGAHIGTCIVPILAALPMRIGAKRAAISHLLFNLLNVAFALLVWPLLVRLCEWSAPGDLVRQLANLHTFVMVGATLLLLPATKAFTRVLLWLTPSKEPDPAPTFLDDTLLSKPEQALVAVIKELRRMAEVCVDSMMLNGRLILDPTRKIYRRLISNEEIINEVRRSMEDYLGRLTNNYLSRRQTLFLQHLDRCMKDIERIGDHLTHIGDTSVERNKIAAALLPEDLFRTWFTLFCSAKRVIVLMARSFDPDTASFQNNALDILRARDAYMIQSMDARADFVGAVRDKLITPVGGYFLSRYIEDLDRLVRRAKSIALAERQPDFGIKQRKLKKVAQTALSYTPPSRVNPKEYLAILQKDSPFDSDGDDDLPETPPGIIPANSPHQVPPDETPGEEPPA